MNVARKLRVVGDIVSDQSIHSGLVIGRYGRPEASFPRMSTPGEWESRLDMRSWVEIGEIWLARTLVLAAVAAILAWVL